MWGVIAFAFVIACVALLIALFATYWYWILLGGAAVIGAIRFINNKRDEGNRV